MNHLSPFIQDKLCEAIAVLMGDEPSSVCLENFSHCLFLLDLYKKEIPQSILEELHGIMDSFVEKIEGEEVKFRSKELSNEEKAALAERLLLIYIDVKGGNLIY